MELENGVTDQPATGQGVIDQPATGQGVDQPAPGQAPDLEGQTVPYSRFKEVNEKAKIVPDLEAQLQVEKTKAQQYEAILANQARPQQPQQPSKTPLQAFMEQEGIGADGFLTAADVLKIETFNTQQFQQQQVQNQTEQWLGAHPDYVGVVVTPTGTPSENLLRAIQSDPALGASLRRHWDPVLAYHAARGAVNQTASSSVPNPLDAIKAGSKGPQGISAASGGGGTNDLASWVRTATDDQMRDYLAKRRGKGS